MKYKEQIQEEWLQINIKLNNLLSELEKLDKEREKILEKYRRIYG